MKIHEITLETMEIVFIIVHILLNLQIKVNLFGASQGLKSHDIPNMHIVYVYFFYIISV
jgi:hypothetical protein